MPFRFLIFLCLLNTIQLNANPRVIDSLMALIEVEPMGERQIDLYNNLAFAHYRSHPNKTMEFSGKALALSEEIGYEFGKVMALKNKGIAQYFTNNPADALGTFKEVIRISEEQGFKDILHRALNNAGNIFKELSQLEKAMEYFQKASLIAKMEGDNIGYCKYVTNLSGLMTANGELDKAFRQYEIIYPIAKKLNDLALMADIYFGMGNLFYEKKSYDRCLEFWDKAYQNYQKTESTGGALLTQSKIAQVYFRNKDYQTSKQFNKKALQQALEFGVSAHIATCYSALANDFLALQKYDKADEMAKLGLTHAKIGNNTLVQFEIFQTLTNSKEKQSDFEQSLSYLKQLRILEDSLRAGSQTQKIKELTFKYDYSAKEKENEILRNKQMLQGATIKKNKLIAALSVFALFSVSILAFFLLRTNNQKRKFNLKLQKEVANRTEELANSNSELKQSNKELERFAHIASHDLKEPLRNITSFIRLIERRLTGTDEYLKEYLQYVQNNAKQMNLLVEDVLEFSRINQKQVELEFVNLVQIIRQVQMALKPITQDENVRFELSDTFPEIVSNGGQLYLVLKNLIDNGIRFNESFNKVVKVYYEKSDGFHFISVSDNGIGIENEYHVKIFEMFERLQNREHYQGSGLGLSLSKKIIERMGGSISVNSVQEKGSTFVIKLPILEMTHTPGSITFTPKSITEDLTTVSESS